MVLIILTILGDTELNAHVSFHLKKVCNIFSEIFCTIYNQLVRYDKVTCTINQYFPHFVFFRHEGLPLWIPLIEYICAYIYLHESNSP